MALQLGAIRDALISAGAPTDKADKAAEELAGYENRLGSIETRLTVLTWMVGTHIIVTVAMGGLLLRVASKVGALTVAGAIILTPTYAGAAQNPAPHPEPYSCRQLDDAQRACGFNPACDKRVIERLVKECLRDGGRAR